MERIDVQLELLEWHASVRRLEFVENFDRVSKDTLSVQIEMNRRSSALHSSFITLLSDLAVNARAFNEQVAELQKECISMTGQMLGIQNETNADIDCLDRVIAERIQNLEKLKSERSEELKGLKLREQCVREQLAHLTELRELQKNRLKGELDSSYRSALQSLRRLRSEFEEIYTCEEVATSLAIETERRIAEKSHCACEKMFQSAKNRIRRMETVRRKRLADIRQTLDELCKKVKYSEAPNSDDDPIDDLPSILCAIDDTSDSSQPDRARSKPPQTAVFPHESPPDEPILETDIQVESTYAHIGYSSEPSSQPTHDTGIDRSHRRASFSPPGSPSSHH